MLKKNANFRESASAKKHVGQGFLMSISKISHRIAGCFTVLQRQGQISLLSKHLCWLWAFGTGSFDLGGK